MKVIKNVTAMMLVVATFAFCGLGAYAAKTTHFNNAYGRAYTNSSFSFNEIYCCVKKDKNIPTYDRCYVRLKEGTYDSNRKYSSRFSTADKSSYQVMEVSTGKKNNRDYTCYTYYGLEKK